MLKSKKYRRTTWHFENYVSLNPVRLGSMESLSIESMSYVTRQLGVLHGYVYLLVYVHGRCICLIVMFGHYNPSVVSHPVLGLNTYLDENFTIYYII